MPAGILNLTIEQGATYRNTLTWKDASGSLVNLTGATAKMQIRPDYGNATVLHQLDTNNGGITLGGTAGTVALYIAAADTAGFTWTSGVYDLDVTLSNGDVVRLVQGGVGVSPEVTQ